jgi:hypothetical protein
MKFLTPIEAETKRQKAVEFLHRIGKPDEAERFEAMTPEEYAEHKGAELLENPGNRRAKNMARSKQQLQAELDEANDYIEQLEGKLDEIVGIASDEDDEEDEEVEEEEEEDDEE